MEAQSVRKWCILEDGILTFSESEDVASDDQSTIYMDRVVSIRTTDRNGHSCIMIKVADSDDRTIALKTTDQVERSNWIFAFQKSVAVVLNRTISASTSAASSPSLSNHDQSAFRRMLSVVNGANGRALTTEDLPTSAGDRNKKLNPSNWIRCQSIHGDLGDFGGRAPWEVHAITTEEIKDGVVNEKVSEACRTISSSRSSPSSFHEAGSDDGDDIFPMDNDDSSGSPEGENPLVSVTYGDHRFEISRFKVESRHLRPKLRWRCGSCSEFGPREKNEDRYVTIEDVESTMPGSSRAENGRHFQSYFGVYDGHSGYRAAEYVRDDLHANIFRHPCFFPNIQDAIFNACVDTDKAFLAHCKEVKDYSGTTAIGAFIRDTELTVFGIGDSQAVIGRKGDEAFSMNTPHKPGRPDESDRITQAGGWVTEEKDLYLGRLHHMDLQDPVIRERAQKDVKFVTIHRVCGELSVSRSIGDRDYKGFTPGEKAGDAYFLWPDSHDQIFYADLVIPNPEFKCLVLEPNDEFLILASDGLWDVISEVDAVKIAGHSLRAGRTPDEVSHELSARALKLGSSDNVTVIIVQFFHNAG